MFEPPAMVAVKAVAGRETTSTSFAQASDSRWVRDLAAVHIPRHCAHAWGKEQSQLVCRRGPIPLAPPRTRRGCPCHREQIPEMAEQKHSADMRTNLESVRPAPALRGAVIERPPRSSMAAAPVAQEPSLWEIWRAPRPGPPPRVPVPREVDGVDPAIVGLPRGGSAGRWDPDAVGREGGFECGCGRLRVQGRPSSESSSLQLLIAFRSKCSRSPSLDATVENEAGLGFGGRPLPRFVGEREGGAAGFRGLGWDGPSSS